MGEKLASPLAKRAKWGASAPDQHTLNRFAATVVDNLEATLGQLDHAGFDAIADLLADPNRRVYMMGGRITHAIADYFCTVLTVMREDVSLLSDMSNTWPPALLNMGKGDVVIIFDIRRYETSVLTVAELARERGAEVVLITDRWVSPAAAHASHLVPCHIEVPSAWDSNVSLLFVVEALLAAVQSRNWEETKSRLTRMEELLRAHRILPARPLRPRLPLFSAIHWNVGVICFLARLHAARAEAFPDMLRSGRADVFQTPSPTVR